HRANVKLREGKLSEAQNLYSKCLNYMKWLPEARLGLALCHLYSGDARRAISCIEPLISYTLDQYKAADPDPVEWSCYVLCFLCMGRPGEAFKRASNFPSLRHPELDRMRWMVDVIQNRATDVP